MSTLINLVGHYYETLFALYREWSFWLYQIPFFAMVVFATFAFMEGCEDYLDQRSRPVHPGWWDVVEVYRNRLRFRFQMLFYSNVAYIAFVLLYVFNHM